MIVTKQTVIEVVANPWLYLSPTGKPQGACPRDEDEDGPGHIGARFDKKTGEYVFVDGPVKVRASRYTRDRICNGEIFLATREAAPALGIEFRDPKELLAESRAAAIAAYDDQCGAGAWAEQNEPKAVSVATPDQPAKPTKASGKPSNNAE
jgi:hypothetical protein